jgi:hypothetical protein
LFFFDSILPQAAFLCIFFLDSISVCETSMGWGVLQDPLMASTPGTATIGSSDVVGEQIRAWTAEIHAERRFYLQFKLLKIPIT